jgi:HEAT repeat protein
MKRRLTRPVLAFLIICIVLVCAILLVEWKVHDWAGQLDDSNEWTRMHAASALGKCGPLASPAAPALIRTLKSRKPLTRPYIAGSLTVGDQAPGKAREALIHIGASAVPALTRALEDDDALTRVNAAWALWEVKGDADQVIPVLVAAWKDKELFQQDEDIRYNASTALGEIGKKQPEKVMALLRDAMEGDDREMVYAAGGSFAIMGASVKDVVVLLVVYLKDERDDVAHSAELALRRIGSAAIPLLIATLSDDNPKSRSNAAHTLAGMEKGEARAAEAALRRATQDDDEEVKKWATFALKQIGANE